ncbi:hypothetical protein HY524_00035 [Candidatus Berkelbacteria bacterium]|nr:hypothetical protein [Candidatus Berkelbacteria bacterium]
MTRPLTHHSTDARFVRRLLILFGVAVVLLALIALIPRPSASVLPTETDREAAMATTKTITTTGVISQMSADSLTVSDGSYQSTFLLNASTVYQQLVGTKQQLELRQATLQDVMLNQQVAVVYAPATTSGPQIALGVQLVEVQ